MLHTLPEFKSSNIDSFRVTIEQYCKIILFYTFLSNETDIFRVTDKYDRLFHRRWTRQYLSLYQMRTYSKSNII